MGVGCRANVFVNNYQIGMNLMRYIGVNNALTENETLITTH